MIKSIEAAGQRVIAKGKAKDFPSLVESGALQRWQQASCAPRKYDPDRMNADRAGWASIAVKIFIEETGTDNEDAIADLICNLMHLCDKTSLYGNFANELRRAMENYAMETAKVTA